MDEVLPLANELDKQKADIPRDFLRRIGAMGYFGIMIGREYGGMGLGVFEYALITEELARGWMSVASIIARGNGMGTQVARPGAPRRAAATERRRRVDRRRRAVRARRRLRSRERPVPRRRATATTT